jgi:hypothetical protein
MPQEIIQPTQYLRILGRLYPNNLLVLRPSYIVSNPGRFQVEEKSPLIVCFYDEKDKLLLSAPLALRAYDIYQGRSDKRQVSGRVPLPPGTRRIRFFLDDILILEQPVEEGKPAVRFTLERTFKAEGRQKIQWKTDHSNQKPLQYIVRYSHDKGRTWLMLGTRTDTPERVIDFDKLPGGKECLLSVMATDGANTSTSVSKPFAVKVKPCQALILFPPDGARFLAGEPIRLYGQGFYQEENQPELELLHWSSSLDGELGTGQALMLEKLSPGEHTIRLVVGKEGREGEAVKKIVVG